MSRIRFERRTKKKLFLLPLLVILLLYITIPVVLINKGSKQLEKAEQIMNKNDVYSPPTEFYNGMAFLQTASSIPGFAFWADNILASTTKKMIEQKDNKLKLFLVSEMSGQQSDSEVVIDSIKKGVVYLKSQDGIVKKIELNDSLLDKIDSVYCQSWHIFFEKNKLDKSTIHTLCKK